MKFVLTPITMIFWYVTTYYGLYFAIIGISFLFSLSWLWLIIFYPILIGLLFGVVNGLPSLLRQYVLKLYNFNRISSIVHGIAGVIGIYRLISFFISNPPMMISDNQEIFFLSAMWNLAPIKTIFLVFPLLGLGISLIWSTAIVPFFISAKDEIEH